MCIFTLILPTTDTLIQVAAIPSNRLKLVYTFYPYLVKIVLRLLLLILILFQPVYAYEDLSIDHELYEHITNLTEARVIRGYPDDTFRPDAAINRGEISKMIVKAFEIQINQNCADFNDLDHTAKLYRYAMTLKCNGIISGFSDGSFRINDTVTREAAMKFIISAARYSQNDQNYISSIHNNIFVDVTQSNFFKNYINAAYSNNIITGYHDSKFKPKNFITRAEAAKLIDLMYRKLHSTNKCIYSGKIYSEGQGFGALDNCNTCICVGNITKCSINICSTTVDYTITINNLGFSPKMIKTTSGTHLNLKIVNTFGLHNFSVPELNYETRALSTGESQYISIKIPAATISGTKYVFMSNTEDDTANNLKGYITIE